MKKIMMIIFLFIFLVSYVSAVNAKLTIINTNKYEPSTKPLIEKNVTKTIVITSTRRIKNHNFDQTYYDFQRNKKHIQETKDRLDEIDYLNYKDKTATLTQSLPIPKTSYSKYYECYDIDFDKYYNDYNYWNPCQN